MLKISTYIYLKISLNNYIGEEINFQNYSTCKSRIFTLKFIKPKIVVLQVKFELNYIMKKRRLSNLQFKQSTFISRAKELGCDAFIGQAKIVLNHS